MSKQTRIIQILVMQRGSYTWRIYEEGKYTREELEERFEIISSIFPHCRAVIAKNGRVIKQSGKYEFEEIVW